MKLPRHRLFWRIYLNGLLLIVAAALAVAATAILLPPESRLHGRPEHLHRFVAAELARHLGHPEELQATLDRFAQSLERGAAVYRRDGALLAASGQAPPPLAPERLSRIGDWHPLRHAGGWIYAVDLDGEDAPYLLLQGAEGRWLPFLSSRSPQSCRWWPFSPGGGSG